MTVGVYFDIDGTLVSRTTDDDEFIPTADSFDLTLDEDAVKIHDQLVEQYFRRNISNGYRRATEVWCEQYGFDLDSAAFTQQLKAEKIETTRRAISRCFRRSPRTKTCNSVSSQTVRVISSVRN